MSSASMGSTKDSFFNRALNLSKKSAALKSKSIDNSSFFKSSNKNNSSLSNSTTSNLSTTDTLLAVKLINTLQVIRTIKKKPTKNFNFLCNFI